MPDRRPVSFDSGKQGLIFLGEPRKEAACKKEIEKVLEQLEAKYYEEEDPDCERICNAEESFVEKIQAHLRYYEENPRTLMIGFTPCTSKVNGYMPYFARRRTATVPDMALYFFAKTVADADLGLRPRFVHKLWPFTHSCRANYALIVREAAELAKATQAVVSEEGQKGKQVRFAVNVTIKANTSLESSRSKLKCALLKILHEGAENLKYDESLLETLDCSSTTDDQKQIYAPDSPYAQVTIVYTITVLSNGAFLGYMYNPEKLYGYSFRKLKQLE